MAIKDELYDDYLSALLTGNKPACAAIVRGLLDDRTDLKVLYTDLMQRAMYRVGELWETNRISVAVEHLATSITEGLMTLIYPVIFASERAGRTALVSCVANEFHQVGAKMAADIFELNGWDGYFLGANTPPEDLIKMMDHKKPEILGLSLSVFFNFNRLLRVLDMVKAEFPEQTIIVGGQAFIWGGISELGRYRGVSYIGSLQELDSLLKSA